MYHEFIHELGCTKVPDSLVTHAYPQWRATACCATFEYFLYTKLCNVLHYICYKSYVKFYNVNLS